MVANSIYLLTALLIHLAFLTAGLSLAEHYELIYLLALAHFPAILLCVITAIISLLDIEVLSKIFLGISLVLTASQLYKSWLYTYGYFQRIYLEKQTKKQQKE